MTAARPRLRPKAEVVVVEVEVAEGVAWGLLRCPWERLHPPVEARRSWADCLRVVCPN